MFVVCLIVTVVLAAMLLGSGFALMTRVPQVTQNMESVNAPVSWWTPLAVAKIAGAVGLLVGLGVPALGIAAAIGVIAYFVGAVIFHLRAGHKNLAPPGMFLVLAIAALVLRIATA